eukprot:g4712.t1
MSMAALAHEQHDSTAEVVRWLRGTFSDDVDLAPVIENLAEGFGRRARWTDFKLKRLERAHACANGAGARGGAEERDVDVGDVAAMKRDFWWPNLAFQNILSMQTGRDPPGARSVEEWYNVVDLEPQSASVPAVVTWHLRAHACFLAQYSLKAFPCDVQDLCMVLRSYHPCHGTAALVRLVDPVDTQQDPSLVLRHLCAIQHEFFISSKVGSSDRSSDGRFSMSGNSYPERVFTLHVARKSDYYMWHIVLPLFFITGCGFGSILVPTDSDSHVHESMAMTFTMLLTSVAFRFVIMDKLPNVNYLSLVDKYTLLCFLVLVLTAMFNVYSFYAKVDEV